VPLLANLLSEWAGNPEKFYARLSWADIPGFPPASRRSAAVLAYR